MRARDSNVGGSVSVEARPRSTGDRAEMSFDRGRNEASSDDTGCRPASGSCDCGRVSGAGSDSRSDGAGCGRTSGSCDCGKVSGAGWDCKSDDTVLRSKSESCDCGKTSGEG